MANAAASSPCRVALLAALLLLLLPLSSRRPTVAAAAAVRTRARHKRTVSDLVDGLMDAMSFHAQDPSPLPSAVIARIARMPTAVYE